MENEKEYIIPRGSQLFKRLNARKIFAQERINVGMTDLEMRYWQGYRDATSEALNWEKDNQNAR